MFVRAGSRWLNTTTTVTPRPLGVSRTTVFCGRWYFSRTIFQKNDLSRRKRKSGKRKMFINLLVFYPSLYPPPPNPHCTNTPAEPKIVGVQFLPILPKRLIMRRPISAVNWLLPSLSMIISRWLAAYWRYMSVRRDFWNRANKKCSFSLIITSNNTDIFVWICKTYCVYHYYLEYMNSKITFYFDEFITKL